MTQAGIGQGALAGSGRAAEEEGGVVFNNGGSVDGDKAAANAEHGLNGRFDEGVSDVVKILSQAVGDVAEGVALFKVGRDEIMLPGGEN